MELDNNADVQVVREARNHFLVPMSDEEFWLPLDAQRLAPASTTSVQVFKRNLDATWATTCIPWSFAAANAHDRKWQAISTAERIRAMPLDKEDEDAASAIVVARAKAEARMEQELASAESRRRLGVDACSLLTGSLGARNVALAAKELLRQASVLSWGALEVLARDLAVSFLNSNPSIATGIAADPNCRKRFELKAIPLETMTTHGFDLTGCMGSILINERDLSDICAIRALYAAMFPNNSGLGQALSSQALWMLNQRRHVVVHRRSVVDRQYLERTGDAQAVGSELDITPADVEQYLLAVRDCGIQMVLAVYPGCPA